MNPAIVIKGKSRAKGYFIPVLPALSPTSLTRRTGALSFPFSHPRYYDYYFGRNAVWHGMKQIGLPESRRILVPAYHHGVEVEAILQAGYQVDFYRVDLKLQIDLEDLEKKITPETGMIYLIYYIGFPHPVEEVLRLCKRHGLSLAEDCALSLFSEIDGKPVGSFGDIGIFSFHKTLPLPNGGGLVVNRTDRPLPPRRIGPPLVSTLSHLTGGFMNRLKMSHPTTGTLLHSFSREFVSTLLKIGKINRTSVANMAFDRAKVDWGMSVVSKAILQTIDSAEVVSRRRENFNYLLGRLDCGERFVFDSLPPGVSPLFFPLLVEEKEQVCRSLMTRGIETVDFWGIPHPSAPKGTFGEVEYIRARLLELPIHQGLHRGHLDYMIEILKETLR
jgi:dTDP-4-amino-4,6-dideoxygalactose transaminase